MLKGICGRPIPFGIVAANVLLTLALSVSGPTSLDVDGASPDTPLVRFLSEKKGLSWGEARRWARTIEHESARHDLPITFVLGVIHVESRFRPRARSGVGAVGLMQVMPKTGRELAGQLGFPWRGYRTLHEPTTNIRMGTAYLRWLLDRFGQRKSVALAAYCHGPRLIRNALMRGGVPQRRLRYAGKVMRAEEKIRRELSQLEVRELAWLDASLRVR